MPWLSVTYCCMAHDAAHQVRHINSALACRAGKGISPTVTPRVSALYCSSRQGPLLQSSGRRKKANSIVSPQHQIPTQDSPPVCSPATSRIPKLHLWHQELFCSDNRQDDRGRCSCERQQVASLPGLLSQN